MMKIRTLFRITYLTFVVVVQVAFWGCKDKDDMKDDMQNETPMKCLPLPPAELGLTSIETLSTNEVEYTFGWTEVTEAATYKFTLEVLEVDTQYVHTETTEGNEIKIVLALDFESEVKFKVQSICEDATESETIEDTFGWGEFTVAAVEVVYRLQNQIPEVSDICDINPDCEYVKFDPATTGTFCNVDISRFANYFFDKADFCECAEKDCTTNNFINCLKTKNKQLFGDPDEDCQ